MDDGGEKRIDPKDLMAVERATTALLGTAISLIMLGFLIEKFELFLYLMELKFGDVSKGIKFSNVEFYKYLGVGIIVVGVILSLYTYRYYTKWIEHLKRGEIDTDKRIYFYLTLFVAFIGSILLISISFL